MQEIISERAQDMIVRLWERSERGDPDGLYKEAADVIADLADAWMAAREVIDALLKKLDQQSRPKT